MKHLWMTASLLSFAAAPALADHAAENATIISRLAYQLADNAEALEDAAYYESGWRGPRGGHGGGHGGGHIELENASSESSIGLDDHRQENLQSLAQISGALHMQASDLYYAARGRGRGGFGEDDHRGDNIRREYREVKRTYARFSRVVRELNRYQLNYRLVRLIRSVQIAERRLDSYVFEPNFE